MKRPKLLEKILLKIKLHINPRREMRKFRKKMGWKVQKQYHGVERW